MECDICECVSNLNLQVFAGTQRAWASENVATLSIPRFIKVEKTYPGYITAACFHGSFPWYAAWMMIETGGAGWFSLQYLFTVIILYRIIEVSCRAWTHSGTLLASSAGLFFSLNDNEASTLPTCAPEELQKYTIVVSHLWHQLRICW